MPRQELSPRPGWAPAATYSHIFGHGPGGNLKPSPCQFGLDALLTLKAILGSHASDQSLKLAPDRRATTSLLVEKIATCSRPSNPLAASPEPFPVSRSATDYANR